MSYYYLLSSLPHLNYEAKNKIEIEASDFIKIAEQELTDKDFEKLLRLFKFYLMKQGLLITAPYSSPEQYLYNYYLEIDAEPCTFLREYFLFQRELKNILIALSHREADLPFENKLIKLGISYQSLAKSPLPDFGLSEKIYYMKDLLSLFKEENLTLREEGIDKIEWQYLEYYLKDSFSSEEVFVYGLKLLLISRWKKLTSKQGDEALKNTVERLLLTFQKARGPLGA